MVNHPINTQLCQTLFSTSGIPLSSCPRQSLSKNFIKTILDNEYQRFTLYDELNSIRSPSSPTGNYNVHSFDSDLMIISSNYQGSPSINVLNEECRIDPFSVRTWVQHIFLEKTLFGKRQHLTFNLQYVFHLMSLFIFQRNRL